MSSRLCCHFAPEVILMKRSPQAFAIGFLMIYATALFLGTLWPFDFTADARSIAKAELTPEWIPFTCWIPRCGWTGYFKDKFFNIGIFMPLGTLLAISLYGKWKGQKLLLATTSLAALCSFLIEALQFFLPERHPTASDVLMNTLGGFLGAWLALRSIAVSLARTLRNNVFPQCDS